MFETEHGPKRGHVRPLKFQMLDEDAQNNHQHNNQSSGEIANSTHQHEATPDYTLRRRGMLPSHHANYGPNFSLEYSFPAVILEDICFAVDRSQQQANFLKECLFNLNQAVSLVCGRANADDSIDYTEKVQILKSVNLSVPCGSIFGLLGPSSCGKTTLLRCLLGLLEPSSGSIRLFGKQRRAAQSLRDKLLWCGRGAASKCQQGRSQRQDDSRQVPGSSVGYMPQDLGLYEDFTIAQLLTMFGRYMRMESALIKERIAFMAGFLELPDVNRQVQTLSGGQKRRVSFAIACLHMPPLIILDEPTVGVDPLLRRSIWKYLRRMASEENKTIIITTHYIEEAAQADQVALMRAGEVLVQDTPRNIMRSNNSDTLEEAFLKICNNVQAAEPSKRPLSSIKLPTTPLEPAQQLEPGGWPDDDELAARGQLGLAMNEMHKVADQQAISAGLEENNKDEDSVMRELKLQAQEKLALYDKLTRRQPRPMEELLQETSFEQRGGGCAPGSRTSSRASKFFQPKRSKFVLNEICPPPGELESDICANTATTTTVQGNSATSRQRESWRTRARGSLGLYWALLYKNYRRNVNSIPLLVFQFMLPMIQMISFSLCVGGRPTNVGLGIVNLDQPIDFGGNLTSAAALPAGSGAPLDLDLLGVSLSARYLSFLDTSMLSPRPYKDLESALRDVRRSKLWAVVEIGENFTSAIEKRFDLENFYQLNPDTISQSIIRIYPDRSNKILDMICHRSLVDSFRAFLSAEFEHFRRLPIEQAKPIFDIKPNIISNSIDGYTESIAPGLLASLTYIMAAGLTTFIMVVERSDGILERTYTSGINPVSYLLAHAIFRSLVMMIQIALVLGLTFYVLKQPLVGSIWLAYAMLMVLNMTGIAYGLLISSIVTDQNGAALTIVSSLVVKITLSGILWPFEAIPYWLRTICYVQPLTMPVQALKSITLKGATLGDSSVNLGFLVSLTWLLVFLTISAKRFKFYQH